MATITAQAPRNFAYKIGKLYVIGLAPGTLQSAL